MAPNLKLRSAYLSAVDGKETTVGVLAAWMVEVFGPDARVTAFGLDVHPDDALAAAKAAEKAMEEVSPCPSE